MAGSELDKYRAIRQDSRRLRIPDVPWEAKQALNRQAAFNRQLLEASDECGCFHCGRRFPMRLIADWMVEPGEEDTGCCPCCGEDALTVGTTAMGGSERDWLDIPGYSPPTVNTAEGLQPFCDDALALVKGAPVERICAAYDLRHECWDFDMPILVVAGNSCIDIANHKNDYVSIGVNRISPGLKTNSTWCDGEDWVREYRDYPLHSVLGKSIQSLQPCLEGNPRYANFGLLSGVEIALGDISLKIVNGCDTNILVTCDAKGAIVKEYVEHWKE